MPRLFPNLGRSSRENARNDYQYYEDYDNGYDYGRNDPIYEQPRAPSAWRRVLSKKSRTGGRAYYGEGEVHRIQRSRSFRSGNDGYAQALVRPQYTNSDDTESYVNIPSRNHSPVPIVQRQNSNSLGRIQDAFGDNGTYSPATLEATTPLRDTPRQTHLPMMNGPVEMSTMHEARHEPYMMYNTPMEGLRPDVMRASRRYRDRYGRQQGAFYRTVSFHLSAEMDESTPPDTEEPEQVSGELVSAEDGLPVGEAIPVEEAIPLDEAVSVVEPVPMAALPGHHVPGEAYPPVVVVMQRGRYGEKDTYYIVPGGAPVIFEDDDGNEIGRVGDFSGSYRSPQRPRPVIVEDEYGREIFRAGFGNEPPRMSRTSEANVVYIDGRSSAHFSGSQRRDRYYDDYSSSYRSHRSRDHDYYPDDRRYGTRRYEGSQSGMVYIDPSESSGRSYDVRSYGSGSSFIDLDDLRRGSPSGSSRSAGSSGRRYVYD